MFKLKVMINNTDESEPGIRVNGAGLEMVKKLTYIVYGTGSN